MCCTSFVVSPAVATRFVGSSVTVCSSGMYTFFVPVPGFASFVPFLFGVLMSLPPPMRTIFPSVFVLRGTFLTG